VALEAGFDGMKRKIDPGDPTDLNIYHLSENERRKLGVKTLPTSLKEALEEWSSDNICEKAIGKENAEKYKETKMQEWKEYEQLAPKNKNEVNSWELQKYLYS
jgi:glutamine synthetase